MKYKISITISIALGALLYDLIKYHSNLTEMDWFRAPVIAIVSFILLLFVPQKFLASRKKEKS